jgi:hypothetical protein
MGLLDPNDHAGAARLKLCAFFFFAGTIGADICFGPLLKREYVTARAQMGTRWTPYVVDLAAARDATGEMGLSRTALALVAVVALMDPTGPHLE